MTARRIIVRGRVQGVGFRWHALRLAAGLPLTGWVRNLPDGSVECFVQGEEAAIRRFMDVLSDGPPGSRVDDLADVVTDVDPAVVAFGIRH